mmetsp:Transcript_19493/g.33471  ORF Transcript_19493/g.33471 Transcript_19493/m.33471 type:complete len:95 (+) Transcript_19493:76-360(+)
MTALLGGLCVLFLCCLGVWKRVQHRNKSSNSAYITYKNPFSRLRRASSLPLTSQTVEVDPHEDAVRLARIRQQLDAEKAAMTAYECQRQASKRE